MNIELLTQLAELIARKRELQAKERQIAKQIEELEPVCQNEMLMNGVPRIPITLDDGTTMTLYTDKRYFAKAKDGCERMLADAFRLAGFEDLVHPGVNTNTLKAFVNERIREGEPIPVEIDSLINKGEITQIRGRISRS